MILTPPNLITFARLVAAPMIPVCFLLLPRPAADWTAFALFAAASLTDYLDGWIARRWGWTSRMGAMLDPIADKALALAALLTLNALAGWNPWLILPSTMIIFREVLVSGMREFIGPGAALKVTSLAKWKTATQMAAVAVLLPAIYYAETGRGDWLKIVGLVLLWTAAALTVITGADYARKAAAYVAAGETR